MANSAQALINATLQRYGLSSLSAWAWNRYRGGDSIEEIMLEMRGTREYRERFPAMAELSKRGLAFSEEAYIQFEQGVRNLSSQFGLPMNIYGTRKYVADLLVNDIALTEVQSRMQLASAASTTAPLEVRRNAQRLYGVTPGQWASIWMETDRTLPELEKQFAAASLAGEVTIANLGDISRTMAERLVESGISREQARQGLSRASKDLGRRLPGESSSIGNDALVSGALGLGGDATRRFEQRVRQRVASFAGGGGSYLSDQGTGLGSTSR